jgi:hypothetical protein
MALQDGQRGGDGFRGGVGFGGKHEEQRLVGGQVGEHRGQQLGRTGVGAHVRKLDAGQGQETGETISFAGQEGKCLCSNGFRGFSVDRPAPVAVFRHR